ncbi:phosphatidylglycerophosphatase A family protein [Halothiobacillus sp.]|jgi:phosphatidylglycerophosphatase A|uniref:phosphatidylglycerophosphatase A family protein n=1 Tax=Halothiobacillus sp. TaxID=1891311 RepID=UPI00260E175B|nr:phosphatidylglycerophosphatase A [Halothiobacillus sp.]MDD4966792.1 phosphatidylglycerophosphatase A [Halothiobacillus sp.]MDY0147296.1 phosphatidylglycerophosphatase A [Halothiobacillus sp.]
MSSHLKNPPIPHLARRVWRDPVLWLAFGFGSGLAPKAPGTFGTLPGVALAWLIGMLAASLAVPAGYLTAAAVFLLTPIGVFLCGRASEKLGVHDHGGIVFDEIVGVLIPFILIPVTPLNLLWGFLAFRVFDVIKPWPISWLDRHVSGGLGIMVDDLLAGIFALAALLILSGIFPAAFF